MKKNKNIKSFIREEDGKTIKKSLLISSLGLVLGFGIAGTTEAGHSNTHSSGTDTTSHSSTHSNHSQHSSY